MPRLKKAAITIADTRPDAKMGPLPEGERLYVGIDIGKKTHWAGLVSSSLLIQYKKYISCPTLSFENSREGFVKLLDQIRAYVPLDQATILLEYTGHYFKALIQFLTESGITVYAMHVRARPNRLIKSDKRDSLALGLHLYAMIEKRLDVSETRLDIHPFAAQSEMITHLQALVRHYEVLTEDSARRRNKLTALCDELFPEFTQEFPNPNARTALSFRKYFPTPQSMAVASVAQMRKAKVTARGSDAAILRLQALARETIGTKDAGRLSGLTKVQSLLIDELALVEKHIEELEAEIKEMVLTSREGQILVSMPAIGPMTAAVMMASIGNVRNFASAGKLRSYSGWAPRRWLSGTSLDSTSMTRAGNHDLKRVLFLTTLNAIRIDSEWRTIYTRLVERKCEFDAEKEKYIGKMSVVGRIAGQMVGLIWKLLTQDAQLLAACLPGETPAAPTLYNRETHHQHIESRGKSRRREASQGLV